jgi:hypothetical protein
MVGGCLDLRTSMSEIIAQSSLKPNAQLRIAACDILTQQPFVFEGQDYDMAAALAATCALPTVFRPVWHGGKLLVDGAIYHYNPADLCRGSAIVSRLAPATAQACEWQYPIDLYFHWRELYMPIAGHRRYVDPSRHVVVNMEMPDVAGLNYGISPRKCRSLVDIGYHTAIKVLTQALEDGRL